MSGANPRRTVLASGLTVLSELVPGRPSVSVGVWLRNGARDEPPEHLGISHFLEHMMFKGTATRDARAIARSLESRGGHLDAFTTREQVCYYARTLAADLPTAVEILSDIVCHSRFAETDVERERQVVQEEILAYEDNSEERVVDVLAEQVWGDHPLGRPILGTRETVGALDTGALRDYFARRYRAEQLVLAATGALEHEALVAAAEGAFQTPAGDALPLSAPPPEVAPSIRQVTDDVQQLYLSLGARGVSDAHPDRDPLMVLNVLLGGGMSSRLFQTVREEAGLAYNVFSALDFYRDSGMLSVHMGVSPERGAEALARTRDELVRLRDEGPEQAEVEEGREQIRGSILMDQESLSARMIHLAHEEIYRGAYRSPEEIAALVMAVTRDQVADVARRYLAPERFSLAALGPESTGEIGRGHWA